MNRRTVVLTKALTSGEQAWTGVAVPRRFSSSTGPKGGNMKKRQIAAVQCKVGSPREELSEQVAQLLAQGWVLVSDEEDEGTEPEIAIANNASRMYVRLRGDESLLIQTAGLLAASAGLTAQRNDDGLCVSDGVESVTVRDRMGRRDTIAMAGDGGLALFGLGLAAATDGIVVLGSVSDEPIDANLALQGKAAEIPIGMVDVLEAHGVSLSPLKLKDVSPGTRAFLL
jgi:hypothetical protein